MAEAKCVVHFDVSRVADGLEHFFFRSSALQERLSAFLRETVAELGMDGAHAPGTAPGAEGEGYSLQSTKAHHAFLQLLETELENKALSLAGAGRPGWCDGGVDGGGDNGGDDRDSVLASLLGELRRRSNAADDEDTPGDEISLLGAFPRAMLAASDFQNFQVLLRETARGNAWDMDSMFGGC